jgi:uncharacterized protein
MRHAIGSKIKLDAQEHLLALQFQGCVNDLLEIDDVCKLVEFSQHLQTNRLQHCINVSYYSFLICRKFRMDYKSAARAGMLHDLFLYDWRTAKQPAGRHAATHPKIALRTARKHVALNKVEEDAIVKHMWPLTIRPPRYKESVVVSLADKYCTCAEVATNLSRRIFRRKKSRALTPETKTAR